MRVALASRICVPCRIPLTPRFARSRYLYQKTLPFSPIQNLTYTIHWRQDDSSRRQSVQRDVHLRSEQSESIKPESYQEPSKANPAEAPKTDALLAEQTVSNKEQRRADWIIIKEMAKYIWPKVRLACYN